MPIHTWSTVREFHAALLTDIALQRLAKTLRKQQSSTPRKTAYLHSALRDDLLKRRRWLRHRHLVLGFLRGHAYKQLEKDSFGPPDIKLLAELLPYDWCMSNHCGKNNREAVFEAWVEGAPMPQFKPVGRELWKEPKPTVVQAVAVT